MSSASGFSAAGRVKVTAVIPRHGTIMPACRNGDSSSYLIAISHYINANFHFLVHLFPLASPLIKRACAFMYLLAGAPQTLNPKAHQRIGALNSCKMHSVGVSFCAWDTQNP